MSASLPVHTEAPAGLDLEPIRASLDEVRANVAHAEAQHNPWALQSLSVAEGLLADYEAALRELAEVKAALAAARAEGWADGWAEACARLREIGLGFHPAGVNALLIGQLANALEAQAARFSARGGGPCLTS